MSIAIRRVVTGRNAKDQSIFTSAGSVEPCPAAGMEFLNLWGTADAGATVDSEEFESPQLFPFFPQPGGHGTRLVVVRFPPEPAASSGPMSEADAATAVAATERAQPGLLAAFETDNPGMHTTDSVDYGVCVEGELWLELDDGAEERITPGTVIVQRGTRHAWRNRSSSVATMVFTLVAARRV